MATETLKFGFGKDAPTHTIEYRRATHIFDRELTPAEKVYEVYIDGADEPAGRVEQVEVSTSRSPVTSRIRWGIGHHMEWGWSLFHWTDEGRRWIGHGRHQETSHHPGLYGKTRREAVADMLGLDAFVEKVRS